TNGRPIINMISRVIKMQRVKGAKVRIKHVRAHKENLQTVEEKGNTLADLAANHYRVMKGDVGSSLTWSLGEEWLGMKDQNDHLVYNDIRRSVKKRMMDIAREDWRVSRTQSLHSGCEELCRSWMGGELKAKDNLFLRIVLN